MSANIPDSQANDLSPASDTGAEAVGSEQQATALEPAVLPWAESEDERRRQVEWFNKRRAELEPHEITWMERYHILLAQGFQLRPRLRPGWQPSWTGPGGNAILSEDGEMLRVSSCFFLARITQSS